MCMNGMPVVLKTLFVPQRGFGWCFSRHAARSCRLRCSAYYGSSGCNVRHDAVGTFVGPISRTRPSSWETTEKEKSIQDIFSLVTAPAAVAS